MMGWHNQDQGHLFYSFDLDAVVPGDHLVREIAAVLDLSWVHSPCWPTSTGRPFYRGSMLVHNGAISKIGSCFWFIEIILPPK